MHCGRTAVCCLVIVTAGLFLLNDVSCLKRYQYENPIVNDLYKKKNETLPWSS